MKKILPIVMICFIASLLVGCGCNKEDKKDENKKEEINVKEQIENTIKSLYSDEEKLVYDNGGLYKIVVHYKDNKVTGIEDYYEYKDNSEAKKKCEEINNLYKNDNTKKSITQSGKFVVVTYSESEYKDMSVADVQNNYTSLKPVYNK